MSRRPRRLRFIAALAGVVLTAVLPSVAAADESEQDPVYRRLNASLTEHHIVPRYARLATAGAALDEAARRFCAVRETAPLDDVWPVFNAAADAWHDVEHVEFGPMTSRLRAERLYFWPDPRNTTPRQLAELLAGRDPGTLTAEGFHRASAAVQGLHALDAGPGITGRMRGYCGDAAVDPSGALFAVSCPRGDLAVFWDLATARVIGTADLPDGCGLAPGEAPGTFLLSSGRGASCGWTRQRTGSRRSRHPS